MMMFRSAAAVLVACLAGTNAFAQSSCEDVKEPVESGTLVAEASTLRWGDGLLSLKNGTTHKFSFIGVKLPDIGVRTNVVVGTVYNLKKIEDFAGTYSGAGVGEAIAAGAGEVVVKNDKCVIVKVRSRHEGVRLSPPGSNSIQVKLGSSS
jgi:hypothetical protein